MPHNLIRGKTMQKYRVRRHEVIQPQDQSIKLIPLTKGQSAIVDAADYEWLMQWNWTAQWSKNIGSFYAYRISGKTLIYMHRLITACEQGMDVDHINHHTLDNRRSNLRKGSHSYNLANSDK